MEDLKIIDLYWERSESAIEETQKKYGRYCHSIAYHILYSDSDADECVNDTYLHAWNAMPPQRPAKLQLFLGRITRNLALNRYEYNHAQKRSVQTETILDEFWECIPNNETHIEDDVVLKDVLNRFLASLDKQTRIIFMRRYWYLCSIKEIAEGMYLTESNVKVTLHRTRNKFKAWLEKEGIVI